MATGPSLPDLPPYQLQHLISNVKELLGGSSDRPSSRAGRGPIEVRCAQALGSEIYVGCSDGSLLRYAFVDSLGSSPESYQLLTHQALPSGQAIENIALAPSVEKALVLSNHQIHFLTLPNLEPVEHIKPIRHVVTFALDDAQQRKSLPDRQSHPSEFVDLCVIKRGNIGVYHLGVRLQFRKEIPLPNGATLARLSNSHLCVADNKTYNVIDLENASLIPLIPLSQVPDSPPVKPSIAVVKESEFLLLSWTGSSTLGVFVTCTGDPIRGTLTWDVHPVAICCNYPYVTSLLPSGTIEVYRVESQAICQVIQPSATFLPVALHKSHNGFVVPCDDQKRNLEIVDFFLFEPDTPNTSAIEEGIGNVCSSSQTAPSRRGGSGSSTKKSRTMQPKAGILAVGVDGVYAVATSTLIQQADALLETHKLKEAADLAKEHQKKLEQMKRVSQSPRAGDIEAQSEDIYYVYQRVGYKCLSETLFEDAGNHLFRGNVDPRLLLRLFPALRGTLLSSSSISLPVFHGLASQMRSLGSVDTIIKNYTPHLQPNTRSAPPTSELRKMLMVSARDMLREYLRKWKNKALYSGEPAVKEINQVIDTVLVKLLAESEDTQDLYSLIESSNDILVEEAEETLIRTGQYNALLKINQRQSAVGKILDIFSKLVDGEWSDEDIQDPLGQMKALLDESRDRALIQQWGLWLVKRDPTAGLKLLTSGDGRRLTKADDRTLLSQIKGVSVEAGQQFLEHLILQKRSNDSDLHTQFAHACLDRLIEILHGGVLEFFRYSAFEYSILNSSTPFLMHLAGVVETSSPMFEHVRTRCRAALFLQGSISYDVRAIRDKLEPWADVLGFEAAILDGKLGRHIDALKALVHILKDTASADAYCALGGCAVSPKMAQFIGDRLDLRAWAALVVGGSSRRNSSTKTDMKANDTLEETRGRLLRVLLEVYMSGGEATEGHTARLLNSQGGNLDVLDVLSLVPPAWPLRVVSSFLARSLRQSVHERCEGEIMKSVCLGQNLEVRDNAYSLVREQGALIEEPAPGRRSPPPSLDTMKQGEALQEKQIVVVDEEGRESVGDSTPRDVEKQWSPQATSAAEAEIT